MLLEMLGTFAAVSLLVELYIAPGRKSRNRRVEFLNDGKVGSGIVPRIKSRKEEDV